MDLFLFQQHRRAPEEQGGRDPYERHYEEQAHGTEELEASPLLRGPTLS